MPASKSYLSQLPKSSQVAVKTIISERNGQLSFLELVSHCWDLEAACRARTSDSAADIQARLSDMRTHFAAEFPAWSTEQIDDYFRLQSVASNLRSIAIARRCAFDDPEEMGRMLGAWNRLRQAGIDDRSRHELIEPCATGDLAIARTLARRYPLGSHAIVGEENLYRYAVQTLLQDNRPAFDWLITQIDRVSQRKQRPWRAGIYMALKGIAAEQPQDIAQGLQEHLQGLHRMQQRDELDGASKLFAHSLVRLVADLNPELLSQFDVQQAFPWDAPFHNWVSEHPDPIAGWDLSGTPELIQQIVGEGATPGWLLNHSEPLELVLLGGDPSSRPLLEFIDQISGEANGKLDRARRMLASCPLSLMWGGHGPQVKHAWEATQRRLESLGGQAEVRVLQPNPCPWFRD